jgi:hypothetical protein
MDEVHDRHLLATAQQEFVEQDDQRAREPEREGDPAHDHQPLRLHARTPFTVRPFPRMPTTSPTKPGSVELSCSEFIRR